MSTRRRDGRVDLDAAGRTLAHWVFGDRTGATLFLGAVLFFALTWRIGVFSTDTYAVANTMANLAEGHLAVVHVVYGPPSGITPGMHVVDGQLYGRDFGMAVAGLPLVWLQQGLGLFVDLRIALVGLWSLGLLGLVTLVGGRVGRGPAAVTVGTVLALGLFVANVATATPLPVRWYPVVALQVVTIAAAALTAVFVYRLLRRMYGVRVGWVAGTAVALSSPVAFWATFPKRHAVTALLVVLAMYCLYRSRDASEQRTARRFRAVAYATVGAMAWVHAAEGLVLLVALVAVDLPTARSNRPRDLALVGGVLFVSLLPFFLTNYLIAGNALNPPRLLDPYHDVSQRTGGAGGTGTAPGTGGPTGSRGILGTVGGVVAGVAVGVWEKLTLLSMYMARSVTPLFDADRMSAVFLRSGYIAGLPPHNDRAINLSVLESMPLLALLAYVPALVVTRSVGDRRERVRSVLGRWLRRRRDRPARVVDAFALVYLGLLALLVMSRLPTQFMLTVRYLHPIYPIGVYFLARLPPVRRAVTGEGRRVAIGYALAVALGAPLYVGALWATAAILSEAVQLYALVSLSIATVLAVWVVVEAVSDAPPWRLSRTGAPLLGVAAGLVTVYLLVGGLGFFAYTREFALPLSRVIAEHLLPINPLRSLF